MRHRYIKILGIFTEQFTPSNKPGFGDKTPAVGTEIKPVNMKHKVNMRINLQMYLFYHVYRMKIHRVKFALLEEQEGMPQHKSGLP